MIKVVADSTGDLPAEIARAMGISVVPMLVEVDGVTYRDQIDITRADFYTGLPTFKAFPRTAATSPETFLEQYRAAAAQGATEIISVHIARKLSGVCASADIAAAEMAAEGVKVHVVDSGLVSIGCGWLALTAAHMAADGRPADQILARIQSQKEQTRTYAAADTLRYLRKGGRINALIGGIGEMLQLRLLVELKEGVVHQIARARSRKHLIDALIQTGRAHLPAQLSRLAVLYTRGEGIQADIQCIQTAFADVVPESQQFVIEVTPVIGAHFGPLAMGIVFA